MPGKEPGATDVLLEVKDNLPVHVSFDYDNFGSKYISKNRYQISVVDNNLFGFEDVLSLQYSLTERETYYFKSARYLLPATDRLNVGGYFASAKLHLGGDYKNQGIYGKSTLTGAYATYALIDEDDFDLTLNAGFDYKDIFNQQFDNITSWDKLRVVKAGFDMDISDSVGRTIVTNEIDFGIPSFLNGLSSKDSRASRDGAGGEFIKYVLNFFRLVSLPFQSNFLWKNQLQLSNTVMTSTEQLQLGGIANVRGYPAAEKVGDYGVSTSAELSIPVYIIPKNIKIPFTKTMLYDAVRLVAFYDYGAVRLRRPLSTEKKFDQLSGAGFGVRFNLPRSVYLRADFAWALDKKPSDDNNFHAWLQASVTY